MKTVRVKVSDFSESLQVWLDQVNDGESLALSKHGKIIAHVIPETSEAGGASEARIRLSNIASQCRIGDVISPLWESWDARPGYE